VIKSSHQLRRKSRQPKNGTECKFNGQNIFAFVCASLAILFAMIALIVGLIPQNNLIIETTEKLMNPGVGFYHTAPFSLTKNGGTDIQIMNYNLYHLRINIGAFSGAVNGESDLEISDAALDKLQENLEKLYQNEKCAIVRFAYDRFEGVKDLEPAEDMVLHHIEQVSAVLNQYPNTITAIEVGLVGMYGEMHSSKLANYDTISKLIDKFLTCTDDVPILVRTPRMIYHYLGVSMEDIKDYQIPTDSPAYHRLGIFNDGYLGSNSDLGTYTDREAEIAWLEKINAYVPYGGEVMFIDQNMIRLENCVEEMRQMHLSYLNYEWNYKTTQQFWATTYCTKTLNQDATMYGLAPAKSLITVQQYLENRMGYRFLVRNYKIKALNHQIQVNLDVINIGFGNLTKLAKSTIILQNQNGTIFYYPVTGTNFTGQGTYNLEINHDLPSGNYQVYFCPHLETKNNLPFYTIAFANDKMYDQILKANLLGNVMVA